MASDSVTVGSIASGTSATVTPMAKTSPWLTGVPISSDNPKNPTPMDTAMAAIMRTSRCSSMVSGLCGRNAALVSEAMPASRVEAPVADTTARASPSTTKVPACTSSVAPTGTGTLSPVRVEASISNPWATSTARSAETRSPASSSTRSPRTSSAASTSATTPSRSTIALRGRRSARRSAARSARYSCTKANTPLRTTTMMMAIPSCGRPARNARTAATQSIRAKNPTNCRARCRQAGGWGAAGRTFGPSSPRRRAASADVNPCCTDPSEHAGRRGRDRSLDRDPCRADGVTWQQRSGIDCGGCSGAPPPRRNARWRRSADRSRHWPGRRRRTGRPRPERPERTSRPERTAQEPSLRRVIPT